jgi:hypothetical protein
VTFRWAASEKGEELSLEELALRCSALGLVSRMVGDKMPGNFNITSIKAHLSKAC